MAKATTTKEKESTYVTGFCGVGNHERCPAVLKNEVGGRYWTCSCRCHAEGNTGWEPPPLLDLSSYPSKSSHHFSVTIPIESASPEAWAAIFGADWDMVRLLLALREVVTKLDLDT